MFRELAIKSDDTLAAVPDLVTLGQAANAFAGRAVFDVYRGRKSANTIRRQAADLALFAEFIRSTGVDVGDLATDPEAWKGITWGLVAAFQGWQLGRGYAVSSVNVRISTIKTYANLAFKAGVLDATAAALIKVVEGYSRRDAKHLDEKRQAARIDTRTGNKKARAVAITPEQAAVLKDRPGDTAEGRRDALIMALMLDLGLRVGEVAGLRVENFDLGAGLLTFYRPKVDKMQTHKLSADAWRAAGAYIRNDALGAGDLWRRLERGGEYGKRSGITDRAIALRVSELGAAVGLEGLSPHDCRHFWATQAARSGTPLDRLQDAGGWSSPAMPLRYIQAAAVANQGVKLE